MEVQETHNHTEGLQQSSLIGSETHSFRYDLILTIFVSSFSLISELLHIFLSHSFSLIPYS